MIHIYVYLFIGYWISCFRLNLKENKQKNKKKEIIKNSSDLKVNTHW